MSIRTRHPLVARYLKRLDSELEDLPEARQLDIRSAVYQQIDDALADSSQQDADIRRVLERMGPPSSIALRERERFGVLPPTGGAREMLTIILVLIGGVLIPLLGWFAGIRLLWSSPVWTRRDRLIGTFIVPGGLALPAFLGFAAVSRPVLPPLVVSLVLVMCSFACLGTTIYLARRMRRAA